MNMISESASGNVNKIAIDGKPVDESNRKTLEELNIKIKDIFIVVATLLTTVTYQAGLTPPSAIWKEGTKLDVREAVL
ncbi:hypothetical protein L6164_026644 [Bauhinia variegata]|uniref:Uncharacterized protein n=1 Tax=Bauhinia variegata TaxID=167791 RepID=A0ACB9LS97_BAUVA|nr:hypothetical protein L6164_026644 [Bauhinia variegata]